ncbi:hypothetical protein Ndes2526B_g00509 [Nannochloris sp. 'desiccata']|nr:putative Ankyrin repeat domain-containing protein 29 [Chlorella desiccata (nom. nud.)]
MAASKTQLIQAAIQGSIDAFEKASSELPKGTASQDIQDDAGSNALHVASHHGHTDLVEHLVDQCGFEVNSQVDAHGRNALAVAVAANQPATVKSLLTRGGSATSEGPHGPLIVSACTSGHPEVVSALLEGGADANTTSKDGMPAVFLTSAMAALKLKLPGRENEAQGGLDCLDRLLKAGATPNVSAPGGFTPLHVAAEAGSERMTSALIAAGADATAKNAEGQTPAAVAASWGHRAIAETLLRSSAGDNRSVDQLISEAADREAAQRQQKATSQIPAPEEPDDEKAELLKVEGNKAFVAGDIEEALTAYQASLRHKTDAAPVWSNAAAAALRLRKFEEAMRYARVARTLDPKFLKAWYREGQAAEGLKMWEDAAAAYFEAHLLQPNGGTGELDFAEMVKSAVREGKKEFSEKKKAQEAAGLS